MPGSFVTDDLSTMFDTDELADTATYAGSSFGCHFFNAYEVSEVMGVEVENAKPMVLCKTSDVKGIGQNVNIVVGTAPTEGSFQSDGDGMFVSDEDGTFGESGQDQYKVINVQKDSDFGGTGTTLLILSRD